ncbi:hypothetical protein BDM02DRAFT_3185576 [Thelephora ganbajun]|uniref:Uncharacterized protein n=1 Tax=Thelephora ganbajun TaxID=370292 RepID=A0ACB6ZKP9_THEGA|nr:hypothetical protein BDM02DRAFT_3185576 [Thelephora ganbajun]
MSSAQPRMVLWTQEEDERLVSAVASCGSKICWKKVATSMPGRNNKSCRKRWLHSLDPKLRKGRWTSEEDAVLLESVAKYGKRWYEVARALPGRTDDQCAKRYKEAVDPSIRRDPWTAEEDERLWNAFEKHGNKWHTIANTLQGRPAIHCRSRLQSLQRARATTGDATSPSTSERSSGLDSLPSPSLSGFSIPSTPSSSGPLTPSLLKAYLPGEELTQGNSPVAPTIAPYDGEPDCQSNLEVPLGDHQNQSFHISPPLLEHGFPITISTPTGALAGRWEETISPSELWKGCPPENPIAEESVQFYQVSQVLAVHMDPTLPFNNSSPPPIPFTMTCPVPHCCYQCQTVVEIWRHITWTHVRPQPDNGIEGIVEKVVLGNV